MLANRTIAVVVPAYNEEKQMGMVLDTIPKFVDRIVVVNDCSSDGTAEIVLNYINNSIPAPLKQKENKNLHQDNNKYNQADVLLETINREEINRFPPSRVMNTHPEQDRIILINQLKNNGVGAAIARGYKWCKDNNIDCTAVMAGDGQMDPEELESLCRPVVEDGIDYVKGNRLIHRCAWLIIPKLRFLGNSILSILTKVASGFWHVSDTQTGYTAISKRALNAIPLYKIYKHYGMPNDMLVKLNIAFCTIKEVPIKPVYNVGEKSKMSILRVIPRIAWLLFKSFFKRLWLKYLFIDFHPLFLLYHFSFILGTLCIPYTIRVIKSFIYGTSMSYETLLAFLFLFISAFQSLLFAMWMDIQDNERLYK